MPSSPFRPAAVLLALGVVVPIAALGATKPFPGPAGWEHSVNVTATADAPRAQETWKKNDGQQLSYLADAGLSFDDTIALMKKNVTDNGFKPSVDTDRKCDGRRAHEVELTFGSSVVHQLVVDDAPGVTKLTYTRPQSATSAPEVTSALNAYCGTP